jgi:AcrR family transcriptional regulator
MTAVADTAPLPRQVHDRAARTRQTLLDAAEAVFGAVGYGRASVSAITRKAGLAQGTFYTHFASKQAVFVAVIQDRGIGMRKATGDAVRALGPGAGRASIERTGMEAALAFVLAHPDLHHIIRDAEVASPEMHRWWFESVVGAYVAAFRRLTPEPRPGLDVEMLGYVVQGITRGLSNRMLSENAPPTERSMDQVFDLLARGFDGLLAESTPA